MAEDIRRCYDCKRLTRLTLMYKKSAPMEINGIEMKGQTEEVWLCPNCMIRAGYKIRDESKRRFIYGRAFLEGDKLIMEEYCDDEGG